MLSLLANAREEVCVCHVQEHFALGQPTISHHLKILREAGLIRCVKRGIWVHCSLAPAGLAAARAALAAFDVDAAR
jgi:ArsR family transcriptional regulator